MGLGSRTRAPRVIPGIIDSTSRAVRCAALLAALACAACGVAAEGEVALPPPDEKPTDNPLLNDAPVADPGVSYLALLGDPISLDGSASSDPDGTIESFQWLFEDGQTLEGPIVERTFSVFGITTATLTVTDDGGEKNSATVEILVNSPPLANAGGYRQVTTGQTLSFDAGASTDLDGALVSYTWQFSDGQTSSQPTFSRSFGMVGSVTVTLTVTDDLGAASQDQATIDVGLPPNTPPTASFSLSPSTANVGQNVTANGSASSDPDGSIVSYAWNFGDGTTATGSSVSKSYSATGTFTVRLTVTDDRGATQSMTRSIVITTPITGISCDGFGSLGNFTMKWGTNAVEAGSEPAPVAGCSSNGNVVRMTSNQTLGPNKASGMYTAPFAGSTTRSAEINFMWPGQDFDLFGVCPSYDNGANYRVCSIVTKTGFISFVENASCNMSETVDKGFNITLTAWYRLISRLEKISSTSFRIVTTLKQGSTTVATHTKTFSSCAAAFLSGGDTRMLVSGVTNPDLGVVVVDNFSATAQ